MAAISRGVELLGGNFLFGFDQGLFFEAVKSIVVDRKLTLIGAEVGGQGGFFQGPGWYYLLAIPFVMTGGDPYGAMVLMFLLGMLAVFFSIFLTKKMFGVQTAFIVGLLIAISPAIIAQSRFIWPPFVISLLSVFFIFSLFKVLEKKEKFLPLLTFIVGLMFHFEIATGISLFLQLFVFLPFLFFKRLISKRFFILSAITFFLTLSPLFIFDLRHEFIIARGVLKLFLSQADVSRMVAMSSVWKTIINHLVIFWLNFLSVFPLARSLWPVLVLFLLLGSIFYLKDKKSPFARRALVFYLLLSPATLFLVFLLYLRQMWEWWILELLIFYCFLLGIILGFFWQKAFFFRPLIIGFLLLFLGSFISQTRTFYKTDFYDYGGTQKMKGKLEAIDYIYQDAKGEKFGLFVFTPPVYTYAYDYLVWWHGEKKYHYEPHQEKTGLFYLWIEEDAQKPWTYQGWLETVIKDGRILETKQLPSGFIIQKRIGEKNEI